MLTELRLKNFRTFEDEVVLRLRPITVVIGRNSSGKSSLLKFLLMLQQSLDASVEPFLLADGPRVRLGDFTSLRNSNGRTSKLEFNLKFESTALPNVRDLRMLKAFRLTSRKERLVFTDPETGKVSITLPMFLQDDDAPSVRNGRFEISGAVNYRQQGQVGTHQVVVTVGDQEIHQAAGKLNEGVKLLRFPVRSSDPQANLERSLADQLFDPIRHEIRLWQHLEPVRESAAEVVQSAVPPSDHVGQRGQYTLPHLKRLLADDKAAAEFAIRHMARVAEINDVRFEKNGGGVSRVTATNPRTGAKTYLANFGFGVSQALPVIVQGAITPPGHLLMVEQPEAQIHPTAQLEMGEFFADLWTSRGVCSLIETHSANLLLRLRRLINAGKLKASDVSVAYLDVVDEQPRLQNLDIATNGNLQAGLPLEFFGADVSEAMKMRARQ